MNYKQFYTELGKLSYAIAKSDGSIKEVEKEEFLKIIKDELLPFEKSVDDSGTDSAYYTEFEFETLMERNAGVDETFKSFIDFVEKHKSAINGKLKQRCLNVVNKIALTYKGMEEPEKVLIEKLKKKLNTL